MRAGPSFTQISTARSWQSPAPAVSVSAMCASNESPALRTAAMPPCAYLVFDSSALRFVTSEDVAVRGGLEREGQPGDAAADDEVVRGQGHGAGP